MGSTARTTIADITSVGAELDENELSGINGGQMVVVRGNATFIDPPGVCQFDE
ncbi:hypothetical protein ABZU75_28540 [Streptosporangium sp. NPDC005286]|uniref:hypothetical protein n=1 Tax=Streptosporangium sp. NPDC005286 TaxID=3154463 RepID=UPI0033A8DA5E